MITPDPFTVDAAVAALLPQEEAVKVAPKITCIECYGVGVHLDFPYIGDGPTEEHECEGCDGRGYI